MSETPDPADVRAVLREHGHNPPERGRLNAEWMQLYRDITSGAEPGSPDYDAGVTEADFPPEPESGPVGGEQKPRRPRTTKATFRDRLGGARGKTKGKAGGKAKPRHKRLPVDRFCERAWDALARLARPVSPPLSRCLSMEAPIAGLVLEDVVRDTMVDRAIQPFVRAEEKGRKALALFGPPVFVAALEHASTLPAEQFAVRQAILLPMLRESMVLWVDVAGDKVEEKARRDAEMGPVYEQVDRLLAQIWAPPSEEGGVSAEDEAAARAQESAMAGAGI